MVKLEVTEEMLGVFAEAWLACDRRPDQVMGVGGEADRAGLQAVLDRFWDLVPPHLPPEPKGPKRVPAYRDRRGRVWQRKGDDDYPWIEATSGLRSKWAAMLATGEPLEAVKP